MQVKFNHFLHQSFMGRKSSSMLASLATSTSTFTFCNIAIGMNVLLLLTLSPLQFMLLTHIRVATFQGDSESLIKHSMMFSWGWLLQSWWWWWRWWGHDYDDQMKMMMMMMRWQVADEGRHRPVQWPTDSSSSSCRPLLLATVHWPVHWWWWWLWWWWWWWRWCVMVKMMMSSGQLSQLNWQQQ